MHPGIRIPETDSANMATRERLAETLRRRARIFRDQAHTVEQLADRVEKFGPDDENTIHDVIAEMSRGRPSQIW
jgi:hypothetical protein